MTEFEEQAPHSLEAMAKDIVGVFNQYSAVAEQDIRLNTVEFSGNKKTGVEAFASDPEGNGLMVVKVILNQIANQPAD